MCGLRFSDGVGEFAYVPRGALWLILSLVVLSGCSGAVVIPGRSVVLIPERAEEALHSCSRAAPRGVEATWLVTPEVITRLEEDLGKLSRIRAKECCILRARVRQPGSYYRQYVGIVINGRELVYINAFRSPRGHEPWHEKAVQACDGGDDYWGAVYDPQAREFSQLAFNGVG